MNKSTRRLPVGKLDEKYLCDLLKLLHTTDPRIIIGPRFGEDAAVLEISRNQCLVMASDPVTFAAARIGWYLVNVNANDVAALGADPRWITVVVLLPENADLSLAKEIVEQAADAAARLGMTIVGGHTEVTPGLHRPLACGTAVGLAAPEELKPSSGGRPGDLLVLCGYACIEGTALMALEHEARAKEVLGEERWRRAVNMLHDPGISIVRYAALVRSGKGVHAMHDPTEGGIVQGAYEMAAASACGLELYADKIPLYPETRQLCEVLNIDPLRSLASGALLVAVSPQSADELLDRLRQHEITAAIIGRLIPERDYALFRRGLRYPLQPEARDQLASDPGKAG
ncbi:MAG: hypothetical protein DRP22_00420 [Verrucomicrobia bacterium]|nr:MAG: hypothetical protein DRP22_00420 [Verrucomicrobiota bacterium]